ncbi:uncharacterized protein K452DRAFT_293378 [Aplosporella prunicola CBS 121167]|uniref:N-acetyltransferase domain-containing protein n=1 Tax=Aplosporella prunicola CBS 121167 TaxID=1176127 RepID=A0A6A6AT97_9PEZI|nr:uncharacterized protein K452DRAFT_293378 [Aplosporella prunicola CBS 121167]KAF2135232.1 hypothetical protein K452DRAFT_293378 [Aplosporella prunicola CBS 121167]
MVAAPCSISSMERPDFPTIADFLHSSKLQLTINRLLYKDWPNDAAQKSQCTQTIEGAFADPHVENLKAVDETSGDIVGYLGLTRKRPTKPSATPGDGSDNAATAPQMEVPEFFNPEVFKAVIGAVGELSKETAGVDHFEVTYIYVKPSARGKGIGSRLMAEAFERAKTAGVLLTVSTEPAAYAFFAKLGFKETNHAEFDLSKWAPPYSGFGAFRLANMAWN